MNTEERLTRLFAILLKATQQNPGLHQEIEALFTDSTSESSPVNRDHTQRRSVQQISKAKRPKNRRSAAAFDPFVAYEESPAGLSERLSQLDIEKLRDMVAEFGMDPSKLVIKWKSPQRIIEHIVETVQTRLKKGDAFRT